jgi:hypothetical protein
MIANPFVVVPIYAFISSISLFKLFVRHPSGKRHPGNHEVVAAEDFSNLFGDVRIQSADRGAHRNHRGHTDDDADKRQKGPQFMRKNRLKGDLQRIRIEGENGSHCGIFRRRVTVRCSVYDGINRKV